MEILGLILLVVAVSLFVVGGIWFLVESFRESILWGLGCLFISPVQLVFLILHWDVAKKPFGLQLLGGALMFVLMLLNEPGSSGSY
ncbi:MAG: hypothetical protein ACSHX8_10370 [Opitutaceae bacterium]